MSNFTGKISGVGAGLIVPGFWSASSPAPVITDPSFIRGLEAQFTFNGLTLNDKSSPDRYRISKIDGLYDSDLRDVRETHPERHGEVSYPSFYSGRTIVITGTIYAGNLAKLRNMTSDLQEAFNALEESDLIISYPNETETYITGRKIASVEMAEVNEGAKMTRNFMISIRAEDPRFYSAPTTEVTITPTTNTVFGRGYDEQYNKEYDDHKPLDEITIHNYGTAVMYPDIKFEGELDHFVLVNYTTGDKIIVNSKVNFYDFYYFNQNKRSLTDSNNNSVISTLDVRYSALPLVPGNNLIGFGGEAHDFSPSVKIYAKSAWI